MAAGMHVNDANHWRRRAEKMRTIAEDMKGEANKQIALRIAESYEKLARRAAEYREELARRAEEWSKRK
jgi:hypothetical protein